MLLLNFEVTMKKTLYILSPVLYLLLTPAVVHACGCFQLNPNQTAAQAVNKARKSAQAIFSGKVVEVVQKARASSGYYLVVRFEVEKSWKEAEAHEITLTSILTDCTYPFEVGESYLVYAHDSGRGVLDTSVCSRTRRLKEAGEDLKILGRGTIPKKVKASAIYDTKHKVIQPERNQSGCHLQD
jgi:hypothetical protein